MTPPTETYAGVHERRFATYLELAHAGPSEAKHIRETRVPRELTAYDRDGKIVPVRELLKSEAVEGTTLIQTEFFQTIQEGASLAKAMRLAIPVFTMTSNKTSIVFRKSTGYMAETPEGAPAKINEASYEKRDFEAKDYRERSMITQNMIDDCLYDLVAEEARHHGERAENTINHVSLGMILENSDLEHDTAGTSGAQGIKAVASAKGKVKGAGFQPDIAILCADAETLIGQEFLLTSHAGAQQVIAGSLPPFLGLKPWVVNTTSSSTTYTWDYDADGEIGMLVCDSRVAGKIGMRQDLKLESYRDPVRDLVGAVVKLRFAANYGMESATCRCKY